MALVYQHSRHYKDISILNTNYNHYGNSVLSSTSRSNSTHNQKTTNTEHSITSTSSKRSHLSHDSSTIHALTSENTHLPPKRPKFNYKSLLSPENRVKKFLNRLDTDNFSLFSSRSITVPTTVNQLPLEIMRLVVEYVDDYRTSINCLYVNKNFYKAAKFVVYNCPFVTSTYRVAQLVSSLREHPENGELIKSLDLSKLNSGLLVDEEQIARFDNDSDSIRSADQEIYLDYALASWRDWKYRGDPLYGSSLMNSYNLSKSKSTVSVDSLSTVTTMKLRLFKRLKHNNDELQDHFSFKFKKLAKFFKLKKNSSITTATELKARVNSTRSNNPIHPNSTMNPSRQPRNVKFSVRDPKSQPFCNGHPYTNKFLLKYAPSKDIPIGYLIYLIDLCPNLVSLNLSSISLSSDFQIVYNDDEQTKSISKIHSLVEDVLPTPSNQYSSNGDNSKGLVLNRRKDPLRPHHLSDSNVYYNMKSSYNQIVKLNEGKILEKLCHLNNLQSLNLSSISWINYKNMKYLYDNAKFIRDGVLKNINLADSGMVRGLNWAVEFENIVDFQNYFQGDKEPEVENESTVFLRTIGMNY